MLKKILITAGGTGGHIFPAQGLAQQLNKQSIHSDVLFVAGGLSSNRYFDRSAFSFKEVDCSPLISRNPLKTLKGFLTLSKGFYQSVHILKTYQPDVVVGFGSYYTVPTLLAAKWLKIPIILHEANSIPGKANKWFAPYAHYIGVHFPYTCSLLKGKAIEVGMPLREGYNYASLSKEVAKNDYQLHSEKPVVLIFGGSQGAHAINQVLKESLQNQNDLLIQVIHLTGDETIVSELINLYQACGIQACVKTFENQMNRAWKAADIFIGRSGASTIAEAMEFEVPGILIPYPTATDNHQEKNADFLVETVGGGVKILEKDLTAKRLTDKIRQLLNGSHLNQMRQAMHQYKQDPARIDLCQLVLKVATR